MQRLGATDARARQPTVSISDLNTIEEVARSLDRLALPAQVAAVLENRWLQHLLAVSPDRTALPPPGAQARAPPSPQRATHSRPRFPARLAGSTASRLSNWLAHALDELHNGVEPTPDSQAQLAGLMTRLLAFENLVHVRPPTPGSASTGAHQAQLT